MFFDNRLNPPIRDARNVVTMGLLDKNGNMWFTTLTEGVYKYDGGAFKNFRKEDGLCSNKVNAVLEDSNGFLWFATEVGLCKYNGKTFINFPLPKEGPEEVSPKQVSDVESPQKYYHF